MCSVTITEQFDVDRISEWHRDLSGGSWSAESPGRDFPIQREFDASQKALKFVLPLHDCLVWAEISRTKKPVVCEDIAQCAQFPFQERLLAQGVVTVLSVPLLIGGEAGGIMGLRFNHKRTFRPEEIELAQALAHQATLAIQLMRQSEHSRQAAVEAERNRFARDMHDTLAQGFTGVVVQLEAAEDAITKGLSRAADEHIARAGEIARYGLSEARRLGVGVAPTDAGGE
jgi:signal transduction histidine kinase